MSDLSDQLLLRAFCQGDRSAFDALYHRYAARVHATAYRLTGNWEDAEDALQEVFVRLAHKAGTIRNGMGLSSFIYRMTVNCATDCIRRRRASVSLDQSQSASAEVIAVESVRREKEKEASTERETLLSRIEALVPNLPERQAAVFVLRSFQGLSHREIAGILGFAETSSKSHYSLACGKLREWVKARDEEECAKDEMKKGVCKD